jgi:hypothetical protein
MAGNYDDTLLLQGCTISSNTLFLGDDTYYGGGAAMRIQGVSTTNAITLTMEDCIVDDNEVPFASTMRNGGGLNAQNVRGSMTNCVFSNNKAGWQGAAMFIRYCEDFQWINCTFYGNYLTGTYADGAVTYQNSTNGVMVNCVFSDNTDEADLDHTIHLRFGAYTGEIELAHCLFYNYGEGKWNDDSLVSDKTNVLEDVSPYFVDAAGGDFHLQSFSGAIDSGVDTSYTTATIPLYDIEGTARGIDGNGAADDPMPGDFDMGAYEYVPTPAPPAPPIPTAVRSQSWWLYE